MSEVTVRDLMVPTLDHVLLLQVDTPLDEFIKRFADNEELRSIFLVDDERRLRAVVTRQDLIRWVRLQLKVKREILRPQLAGVRRLAKAVHAIDISHTASPGAAVGLDDPIHLALEKMARYDLTDIPVIDDEGRVIGDLRLSQLLWYGLEQGSSVS